MDKEVAVVEQDPLRRGVALDVKRTHTDLQQAFLDGIGDRLDLALVGRARDHEVIGEGGDRFEVANADVFCLGVVRCGYGFANARLDVGG